MQGRMHGDMLVNSRDRYRTVWKALRMACAICEWCLTHDYTLTSKSTLLKRRDYSLTTTSGVSTNT